MSILEELHTLLSALGFPVETGHFTDTAPERYFVTVPLSDRFTLHADNRPGANIEEARISLFSKGSYSAMKQRTVKALLEAEDVTFFHNLALAAQQAMEADAAKAMCVFANT